MKIVQIEPLGITDEQLKSLVEKLENNGDEYIAYDSRETDTDKLIERVKDADVVVLANQPFPAEVVEKCEKLKMISVAFTGVDHVAVDECKKRGICVCNAAGYSTNAVSELVFGLIISLYRKINEGKENMTSGVKMAPCIELSGKKFGIIGTGAIGLKTAEIAKTFGCEVYAYSRTEKHIDGIKYITLCDLMRTCDIISVHVPLNDSTKDLVSKTSVGYLEQMSGLDRDSTVIDEMKSDAILINTARGPIIDNAALAKALKDGKIAGAGIDVFDTEPPLAPDYPLLDAPNTVLMPHIGFSTKEALYKRAVITINNITSWKSGEPQNVV